LSAQNTSYERLRDGAKKQLALELIKQPTRSLADIAQTLGYAELSPFYRAFKRWTGQTPARWRKQQTQK
jgi:AraC-like DNA-binding protein